MLRRVAALVFAVCAVAIGLSVRADRADVGNGDRRGGGGSDASNRDPYDVFERDEVSLLCVEELRTVCDEVDVLGFAGRSEAAWTTVGRLRDGGSLGADVWVTFAPYDELASPADPSARPALEPPVRTGARSPFVLAGPKAAIAALDAACPDAATIVACAATTRAAQLAFRDPRTSGSGTLGLASVAFELGLDPAAAAVNAGPLATQLQVALRTGRRTLTPFADAMRLDRELVALTLEADVREEIEALDFEERARYDAAALRYPLDVRAVEVVAVPSVAFGDRAEDLAFVVRSDAFGFAISDAGYDVEGQTDRTRDVPVFARRPQVRTDLMFPVPLLRSLQELPS